VNHKILAMVVIFGLAFPAATSQAARTGGIDPYSIGVGFGPSDISPISQGVPIFTQGDQLWVENYYNFSVVASLFQPNQTGSTPQHVASLSPTLIRTFGANDTSGTWQLLITDSFGSSFTVNLIVTGHDRAMATSFTGAGFGLGGTLVTSFAQSSADAYDIQACLVGSSLPTDLMLPIPVALGTGAIHVGLNGPNATIGIVGKATSDFTFWFELYHPYSYAVGTAGEVVSRLLEAATIDPIPFSSGANGTTFFADPLNVELPMRDGRYLMRAFFRSSAGLSVQETSLLRENEGLWVMLSGCAALQDVGAQQFRLNTHVTPLAAGWPRGILTMFKVDGVEDYTFSQLNLGLSSVSVTASPWNVPLDDVGLSAMGQTVTNTTSLDGEVYILASSYPLQGSIIVGMGSSVYGRVAFQIPQAYGQDSVSVSVGRVAVRTTSNGQPRSGVSVTISNAANGSVSASTNSSGLAQFYLPAGSYSASADIAGATYSSPFQAVNGQPSIVEIDSGGSSAVQLTYALVALGVAGVVGNVWVWLRYWRRRIRRGELRLPSRNLARRGGLSQTQN
jgi:hypothetical protein